MSCQNFCKITKSLCLICKGSVFDKGKNFTLNLRRINLEKSLFMKYNFWHGNSEWVLGHKFIDFASYSISFAATGVTWVNLAHFFRIFASKLFRSFDLFMTSRFRNCGRWACLLWAYRIVKPTANTRRKISKSNSWCHSEGTPLVPTTTVPAFAIMLVVGIGISPR